MLEQNKSFTQFFSKNCGFPKGKALGRSSQRAKGLSSGAFAGEFFNPNFGLKKRGLL